MAAKTEPSRVHLSEQHEPEVERYRPLSGLAVAALILGLLSLTAWVEPFLGFVAAIGAMIAVAALWQIARNAPEMIGRKAALAGLFLSLFSLVGVSANVFTYRALVRNEAKHFAQQWFQVLQNGHPEKAFDMTRESTAPPDPEAAKGTPRESAESPGEAYAKRPEIDTLVALGGRAQVRYYQTEVQGQRDKGYEVQQVYAVTYDKDGAKTTWFVRLDLERWVSPETGHAYWQVLSSRGGVKPLALGGSV